MERSAYYIASSELIAVWCSSGTSRLARSSASASTQVDWAGSVNRDGFQMGLIDIELPCQCPTSPHLISRTPWTQVSVVQLSSQSMLSAMPAQRIERPCRATVRKIDDSEATSSAPSYSRKNSFRLPLVA